MNVMDTADDSGVAVLNAILKMAGCLNGYSRTFYRAFGLKQRKSRLFERL
jgi:hypothetical protein